MSRYCCTVIRKGKWHTLTACMKRRMKKVEKEEGSGKRFQNWQRQGELAKEVTRKRKREEEQ